MKQLEIKFIFTLIILFIAGCSEVKTYQTGKEQIQILTLQKQSLRNVEVSSARYNCFNYLESNVEYEENNINEEVSQRSKQSYEELQLAEIRAKQANISDNFISNARNAGAAIGRASAIKYRNPSCYGSIYTGKLKTNTQTNTQTDTQTDTGSDSNDLDAYLDKLYDDMGLNKE